MMLRSNPQLASRTFGATANQETWCRRLAEAALLAVAAALAVALAVAVAAALAVAVALQAHHGQ
jgi:hypothetical protein